MFDLFLQHVLCFIFVPENNVQYFIIMKNSVLDQCDILYTSLS